MRRLLSTLTLVVAFALPAVSQEPEAAPETVTVPELQSSSPFQGYPYQRGRLPQSPHDVARA